MMLDRLCRFYQNIHHLSRRMATTKSYSQRKKIKSYSIKWGRL